MSGLLPDIRQLAVTGREYSQASTGDNVPPVVGIKTVSEGIPRILNPRATAANPGPVAEQTSRPRLVLASDLDVVAASGVDEVEDPAARTWRVLAICADSRSGIEYSILSHLPRDIELAGLTSATLHGKAVLLLLGHQPDCSDSSRALEYDSGHQGAGALTVYLDKRQSRREQD